jgi:urea transport system ATP-binding protein
MVAAATMSSPSKPESSTAILAVQNVTVDFDGFKAVQDLNFSMRSGELRFLIGPNGAGKTTLLDVMCGRVKPAKGHVIFKGNIDITRLAEHTIAQRGIGRKFQTPSVFLSLTTRENLDLAAQASRSVWQTLRARENPEHAQLLDECLHTIGLHEYSNEQAGALSHGQKQWLELGMLLMQKPDLMLLDEPAAGMTDSETEKMGEMLRIIARERSVLVVEHDMDFVRQFAQIVTVMHEGKILCEGTMDEVQNNDKVAEVYLERRVASA